MNGNSNNRNHMTSELSTASPTEVVPQPPTGPQQPVVKGNKQISFSIDFVYT